jgi:hypothetical protein
MVHPGVVEATAARGAVPTEGAALGEVAADGARHSRRKRRWSFGPSYFAFATTRSAWEIAVGMSFRGGGGRSLIDDRCGSGARWIAAGTAPLGLRHAVLLGWWGYCWEESSLATAG